MGIIRDTVIENLWNAKDNGGLYPLGHFSADDIIDDMIACGGLPEHPNIEEYGEALAAVSEFWATYMEEEDGH